MTTVNTTVTTAWTKLADDTDLEFLLTWDIPVDAEFATTATDTAPTVRGHRLSREMALSRGVLGDGFVWAKLVAGSIPSNVAMVVTK